jgi:DNA polymerase-1
MKKLALIDGDSLCYLASKETIAESIDAIDNLIAEILDKTGSTHYYLFLSEGKYFRHEMYPEYKGNRKYKSPLKYLKTLKAYLKEQYHAEAFKRVEADDMVAFGSKYFKKEFDHITVCSIDKDVIQQVEGHHYNYKTQEFFLTTAEEASYYTYYQTLVGDSTDNVKGIPGIGPVKAKEILLDTDYATKTLFFFQSRFGAEEGVRQFALNYRLVYLLRNPSDFNYEVGYVPELNEPIEIVS